MSTERNVVIIGLGLAGAGAAKLLADKLPPSHRVVGITEKDFGFFPIGSLRAAVVPGWEDKVTAPLDRLFPKGSRHIVLSKTKVVEIGLDYVVVDTVHEGFTTKISFDYMIVATGSTYASPCRPTAESGSIADVSADFQKLQKQVAASTSIIIAGGGPTGIEFAGEVKAAHPKIAVTLVSSGKTLLTPTGYNAKLPIALLKQLRDIKVDVVLGQRLKTQGLVTGPIEKQSFDLGEGKSVEADFLLVAYGCLPNSSVVQAFDASLLQDNGRVKVKPTLQLVSSDGKYDRIFAVGDITDLKEEKISVYAEKHTFVATANILALIAGKAMPKTYAPGGVIIIVVIGPKGGAGQVMGLVVGAFLSSMIKSGSLFVSKFNATYNKVA